MSTLTKISVVILVVLVLITIPLFLTLALTGPNWKQAYQNERNAKSLLTLQARHAQLATAQANREINRLRLDAQEKSARQDEKIRELAQKLEVELSHKARLENQVTRLTDTIAGLESSLKLSEQQRVVLEGLYRESETEKTRLGTRVARLEDELVETQSRAERVEKMLDILREQISEREERIRELVAKLTDALATGKAPAGGVDVALAGGAMGAAALGGTAEPMVADPNVAIDGTITSVRGDLAGINIGSAKGIRSGMKLIIFRGSEFVGYLRVQEVEVDQAAGTVLERRIDPLKGDKVTTALLKN